MKTRATIRSCGSPSRRAPAARDRRWYWRSIVIERPTGGIAQRHRIIRVIIGKASSRERPGPSPPSVPSQRRQDHMSLLASPRNRARSLPWAADALERGDHDSAPRTVRRQRAGRAIALSDTRFRSRSCRSAPPSPSTPRPGAEQEDEGMAAGRLPVPARAGSRSEGRRGLAPSARAAWVARGSIVTTTADGPHDDRIV